MADEILIPGTPGANGCNLADQNELPNCLKKDNYLSEFETELDKEIVRENLEVHKKDNVYTKTESDNNLKKYVGDLMRQHLAEDDPHLILLKIDSIVGDLVRKDGTTPFTAPQTGVNPVLDFHLTTKKFVTDLLNQHIGKLDPHNTMFLVREALLAYVERSQVYLKKELYTKTEVDRLFKPYITKDGTVPFVRPLIGVTPILDNHLSTKKYVDESIFNHLVDVDPHGFILILNLRLSKFYSKSETYSKAETYSRALIDAVVYRLVADAARSALEEHINLSDPHRVLDIILNNHYVPRDGSVAFTKPLKGVEGLDENDLITLSLLNRLKLELEESISALQPIWKTSGPIQTTVGFMEDNSPVPSEMTLLEIMDAIFYGKTVEVTSASVAAVGSTPLVDMAIRGTGLVHQAYLYLNDELIGTFTRHDFETGLHKVMSRPILENTTFRFVVEFCNGTTLSSTWNTEVSYGVFVGLLPKWKSGTVVTYEYLLELASQDPDNNVMSGEYGVCTESIMHNFNFSSPEELKHIVLAMPKDYPSLKEMSTSSLHFGILAFDVVDEAPFRIPGMDRDVIFKIYIYREALVAFNSEVTFKLEAHG